MQFERLSSVLGSVRFVFAATLFVGCTGDPSEPPISDDGDGNDGRVELGASSLEARNFDARDQYNSTYKLDMKSVQQRVARFAAPGLDATFDDATGVTRSMMSQSGYLTAPTSGLPHEVAVDFARSHADVLGLTADDLDGMEVTDSVYSKITKVTHIYYRQRHQGLPVYNGQLHLNVQDDGRVLSVNNAFMPDISGVAPALAPVLSAAQAVSSAASNLSISLGAPPATLAAPAGIDQRTKLQVPELSREVIDAELMWLPINAKKTALVWRFQVETLDDNHWFDYTVDAHTGKVWTRFDWVAADSYRAYREPVESANHSTPAQPSDGRVVTTNPANAAASPLGWHNTGATAFTIHRGNNVHAYNDRDANNLPPAAEPACTAARDCSFAVNFANQPSTYTSAAITNLFYWNNRIHDVMYQYGFDEPGGNFQVNNFGNGGAGNDDVRAEAQDAAGTNNANFGTPPDGSRPRMQMFEWTTTAPRRDGDFDNGVITHEYGHGISNRLVGGPSNVSCLGNAQQAGEGWSDWFGLWFTTKPGDVGTTGRGIGTYVLGQPTTGAGIRTQRYSTSQAINNFTYQSIRTLVIPHGVGSAWAQVLWEVHWALVDKYGFSTDLFNAAGNAGNQRSMLYVIEGLKNTACSPTFVAARNGIIQAATTAHGGEDVCLLWEKFAAFGLGTNAIATPQNSGVTNGFNLPAQCL